MRQKISVFLMVLMTLSGCAAYQEKAERYKQVHDEFLNAPHMRVCYTRRDGNISGTEFRCFGEGCELPECP